jgi:coenzyme F420-0:L-glutamate ligase/coenzyme F420-1:gamma-L-glutamate ligase
VTARRSASSVRIELVAPDGVPEVRAGDDLAALLLAQVGLEDGDVVVVTSKVVSKAEGRVRPGTREEALPGETARVVARRGPTTIVRTHHGLTMAAAGIDASNTAGGTIVLLPQDPDGSARALRRALRERCGANVAVVVTDTAGRAWREGQTDIAIGAAGLRVLDSFAGRSDGHGNPLAVTAPAVADEVAGAAELAAGKLGGRPFTVVRGLAGHVLAPEDDGPGAGALVRREGADLFGYGAREAVVRALGGHPDDRAPFGAPAGAAELAAALRSVLGDAADVEPAPPGELPAELPVELSVVVPDGAEVAVRALAFAHGWEPVAPSGETSADAPPGRRLGLRPTDT